MADNKLPDISGVFNIDDSRVPTKILAKPETNKPAQESILLPREPKKEEKRRPQENVQQKKAEKARRKNVKRRVMRQRLVLGALAVIVIAALALLVRGAILNSKKPVVQVTEVTRGTITSTYEAEGSVLSEVSENALPKLYVVFVENDYDVYGLQKGQRAEIHVTEETSVTGVVADIRKEESDSGIISRLISIFSGATYSTAANYAVIISPDDETALEENFPVRVTVTTGVAEDVLTVPSGAVNKDNEQQHYVWVYKSMGKKLKRQDVSVGLSANGVTEIKRGLSEGDFVVSDVLGDNIELYNNVKVKLSTD